MHQALYRKWRPQTFDDVCGQEHVTSILKYETENNKFSHAYLFCGSRGTGKTTCAKILAKAVNCEASVNGSPCNKCASCLAIDAGTATDVLEMDAASNNGVDNIRDIRDEVVYTPSALKYRVYIVDEVHMLSGSAFNALLKTLEEPPSHAVFILATTELHKLPSTIVSRCQRYDFRRIATDTLVKRLSHIADSEGISYDSDALRIIAKMAQGGMRDAISLLELCAGNRERITAELVNDTLGVGGRDASESIVRAIAASDFDTVFGAVDEVVRSSKDIAVFWQDLIAFYRDMLVVKTTKAAKNYLDLTDDEHEHLIGVASLFTKETLLYHCRILDDTLYSMQRSGFAKRTVAEMALVKMCDMSLETSADTLAARISKLENAIAAGNISLAAPVATETREEIKKAPQKIEEA
ncbi:MAG: DNA polymerase III subunit gamma/tau, partial [Clostridia bacterium]|nr:DNA polymerase III subunit gamma/tau [Clostridia bacterium]